MSLAPLRNLSGSNNMLPSQPTNSTWTAWGGAPALPEITKNITYTRVTLNTAIQNMAGTYSVAASDAFPIVSGQSYCLSFWARANRVGVVPGYCYLMSGGSGGANKQFPNAPILTTEWARYSLTVASANTSTSGGVLLGFNTGGGNVSGDWIDFKNVQLEVGSTPSEFVPYSSNGSALSLRPAVSAPGGLLFNGNTDYITYPGGYAPIGNNPISVEGWVDGSFQGSLFGHGAYAGGQMFNLNVHAGQTSIDVGGGGITGPGLIPNQKNHLAATYDGTTVILYLNGVLLSKYVRGSALNIADSYNYIGNGYWGKAQGTIYNVNVFNRALSPVEIANHYNGLSGSYGKVLGYDFTNPGAVMGNMVSPNPYPLIPTFSDSRWTIPSGFTVTGQDSLYLYGTSPYNQAHITLPIVGGGTYLFTIRGISNNARVIYNTKDANGNTVDSLNVALQGTTLYKSVTFGQYATALTYTLDNTVAGQFNYYKPQLYQLTGSEGSITGVPKLLNSQGIRTLNSLR